MIWSDPWIVAAATDQSGESRRYCTRISPPPATLPPTHLFVCMLATEIDTGMWNEWGKLVGTSWSTDILRRRTEGAYIAMLLMHGRIVGTCVLRPSLVATDTWILETLRAVRGNGALLLRAAIRWLWDFAGGPVILNFTWELTGAQLLAAWWRGWLRSAAAIQYGWVWRPAAGASGCRFCPSSSNSRDPLPMVRQSPIRQPTLFGSAETGDWAIVSDSGLGDGWGIVSVWRGVPPWSDIATAGRWDALWCRGSVAPVSVTGSEWRWSGEFVVVGALNRYGVPKESELEWVTAEISSASVRAETPPHPADSAPPRSVAGPSVG
jgi:hypothetical protein